MSWKTIRRTCFLFVTCAAAASAQMIVHAAVGKVTAVTPSSISLETDGATAVYDIIPLSNGSIRFSNDLRADSTEPAKFQKIGDTVLLYYFGFGDQRTAVAVKDLGAGTFTSERALVTGYDKHTRTVTVSTESGKTLTMPLSPTLVVDLDNGADNGRKFSPHKGDHVRVTYDGAAQPTIVFLRETL